MNFNVWAEIFQTCFTLWLFYAWQKAEIKIGALKGELALRDVKQYLEGQEWERVDLSEYELCKKDSSNEKEQNGDVTP